MKCAHKTKLMSFRVTNVTVEKPLLLHILSVWV